MVRLWWVKICAAMWEPMVRVRGEARTYEKQSAMLVVGFGISHPATLSILHKVYVGCRVEQKQGARW